MNNCFNSETAVGRFFFMNMNRITLEQLGPVLRAKRGERGIREVAKEIGISPATLSRIETGKQPDLDTFAKLCGWLQIDAGEVLDCRPSGGETPPTTSRTVSVHYKAKRTLTPETAQHLGELILAVQQALEDELAGNS
jgi:transcriptional regulator with XRE-family HTH domain